MPLTTITTSNIDTTNSLFFRNRIINGACVIDQRNAGASIAATDGGKSVDRWGTIKNEGAFTIQQNAGSVTPPVGFTNYIGATVTTAATPTGTTGIRYPVEGYSVSDLAWGTASAKTITISFWARSSLTGALGGSIWNTSQTYSYPFTYTINSANTWEYKTITIPGSTTGSWNTTNGLGIGIDFSMGTIAGSQGTPGTWNSGFKQGATGQVQPIATLGATLYLTGLQLEVGAAATAFEYRPFTTELQLCQRYFCTTFSYGTVPASNIGGSGMIGKGVTSAAAEPIVNWTFPVSMRATPTITTYNPSTSGSQFSNGSNTRVVGYDSTKCVIDMAGSTVSAGVQSYIGLVASVEL